MARLIVLALLLTANTAFAATLVHNIRGYTMDDGELRRFVALEYDKGVVTALYSTEEDAQRSAAEDRVDGDGATLLPGLIDAHGHVSSHGRALASVDLIGAGSEADAVARVKAFAEANAGDGWIEMQ